MSIFSSSHGALGLTNSCFFKMGAEKPEQPCEFFTSSPSGASDDARATPLTALTDAHAGGRPTGSLGGGVSRRHVGPLSDAEVGRAADPTCLPDVDAVMRERTLLLRPCDAVGMLVARRWSSVGG